MTTTTAKDHKEIQKETKEKEKKRQKNRFSVFVFWDDVGKRTLKKKMKLISNFKAN